VEGGEGREERGEKGTRGENWKSKELLTNNRTGGKGGKKQPVAGL